jgi:hypothetical protein
VPAGYGFGTQARRLLAEATERRGGVDGLAELARTPGDQQADAYRDWIDAPERRFVLLWLSVAVGMGWIVAVFVDVRRQVSVPATARASRTSSSSHGGHRRSATPRGRGTTLRRSTMPSPVRSPRDAGTGARRRRRLQLASVFHGLTDARRNPPETAECGCSKTTTPNRRVSSRRVVPFEVTANASGLTGRAGLSLVAETAKAIGASRALVAGGGAVAVVVAA